MNKDQLQTIKYYLPSGWSVMVAEKTGYHVNYVRRVANGEASNEIIMRELIALAKSNKAAMEELQHEIDELTNKED